MKKMKNEVETGDFVVPGDFLARTEEFVPDEGVYEEDNDIYSSRTGVLLKEVDSKKISVHPKTGSPPVLKPGDIVIAKVSQLRGQIANVEIGAVRGSEDREIPSSGDAVIHISKISDDYVDNIEDELRPNDIIRAKVVSAGRRSVDLSTMDDSLGVLVGFCSDCRHVLEKDNSKLSCPNCGNVESRKITNDYRQGIL